MASVTNLAGHEAAADQLNTLDQVIPGIYPITPWDQIADDDWEDAFAIKVRGSYWVARAAFPEMKRRGGGAIVKVSSRACFNPLASPMGSRSGVSCGEWIHLIGCGNVWPWTLQG